MDHEASGAPHPTRPKRADTLLFVGVTTSSSSIMRLFPKWSDHLGLGARIAGIDLPIGATDEAYVACIESMRNDRAVRGALITTHKTAIFEAAAARFSWLDRYADMCREVSCVTTTDGVLRGWAKDPITAGLALDHMLSKGHWSATGGQVVCFGAGGAGLAIAACLLMRAERPKRIVIVDRDHARCELAESLLVAIGATGTHIDLRCSEDAALNDVLVESVPAGSVIINATGMGKDRPGSPVTSMVTFPERAVIWDLNYRGDLAFLRIARAQAAARDLAVHDGWRYFLHGWTEVIAEVFDIEMTPERFGELADIAADDSGEASPLLAVDGAQPRAPSKSLDSEC